MNEASGQHNIKVSTVDTYLSNTMAKLGIHSRSEALQEAIRQGIIVLDL